MERNVPLSLHTQSSEARIQLELPRVHFALMRLEKEAVTTLLTPMVSCDCCVDYLWKPFIAELTGQLS